MSDAWQPPAMALQAATTTTAVPSSILGCKFSDFAVAATMSGAAGIRATGPAFLLSLFHLLDPDEYPLSEQAQWLGHQRACVLLGVLLVLEILADHVPAVDHALHVVFAPAHPVMGAVVGVAPGYCGGWITRAPMAIMGASLAMSVHTSKAVFRAGSTNASFGMLNPVISWCETLLTLTLVLLSLLMPLFGICVAGGFIYCGCQGARQLLRMYRLNQGMVEPGVGESLAVAPGDATERSVRTMASPFQSGVVDDDQDDVETSQGASRSGAARSAGSEMLLAGQSMPQATANAAAGRELSSMPAE
eukprot:gnl/TRDRNA2_/TRDRNA2_34269_c0_seq1.p1 gnl/TRDRNA2_/TRDRNA2_34269_c0~~gnl/TRDRNA2_/TRDRNA2_34269_c0_seq1.p1  ORF type:complete len:304 (-),score=44.02 gnl/TRDRNA2_/TRDRNA2_34269_c0_seq1:24-935(-)